MGEMCIETGRASYLFDEAHYSEERGVSLVGERTVLPDGNAFTVEDVNESRFLEEFDTVSNVSTEIEAIDADGKAHQYTLQVGVKDELGRDKETHRITLKPVTDVHLYEQVDAQSLPIASFRLRHDEAPSGASFLPDAVTNIQLLDQLTTARVSLPIGVSAEVEARDIRQLRNTVDARLERANPPTTIVSHVGQFMLGRAEPVVESYSVDPRAGTGQVTRGLARHEENLIVDLDEQPGQTAKLPRSDTVVRRVNEDGRDGLEVDVNDIGGRFTISATQDKVTCDWKLSVDGKVGLSLDKPLHWDFSRNERNPELQVGFGKLSARSYYSPDTWKNSGWSVNYSGPTDKWVDVEVYGADTARVAENRVETTSSAGQSLWCKAVQVAEKYTLLVQREWRKLSE